MIDPEEILTLALELHSKGETYRGEYKGLPVAYDPADQNPLEEDWMIRFPATFQCGVWPAWSIHIDWENGDDQPPNVVEFQENHERTRL